MIFLPNDNFKCASRLPFPRRTMRKKFKNDSTSILFPLSVQIAPKNPAKDLTIFGKYVYKIYQNQEALK